MKAVLEKCSYIVCQSSILTQPAVYCGGISSIVSAGSPRKRTPLSSCISTLDESESLLSGGDGKSASFRRSGRRAVAVASASLRSFSLLDDVDVDCAEAGAAYSARCPGTALEPGWCPTFEDIVAAEAGAVLGGSTEWLASVRLKLGIWLCPPYPTPSPPRPACLELGGTTPGR